MGTALSMWLGIIFLGIGIFATVVQVWLWSFPMEPDPGGPDPNGKSTAPPEWTRIHRMLGLAFVVIYIVMMWNMVPRLWEYQYELPARSVIHACMGISIGFLLVCKISIIRWFQHFGTSLPFFGTAILLCTVILSTLSLPFALRAHGISKSLFTEANLARVERVMVGVYEGEKGAAKVADGLLDPGFKAASLTTPEALDQGRDLLMNKCGACHDMRTVLAKPRSGESWHKMVVRMAEKPNLGPQISLVDIPLITSYLVAISPGLQNSLQLKRKQKREQRARAAKVQENTKAEAAAGKSAGPYDKVKAKTVYEDQCTQCHELDDVDDFGGSDAEGWAQVVQQMIEEEEAEIPEDDAALIIRFLVETHPKT